MACLDNGCMLLLNINGNDSEQKTRFILPEGKQRWPSCILATQDRFMMGDREGSLHLYSTEKEVILRGRQKLKTGLNFLFISLGRLLFNRF